MYNIKVYADDADYKLVIKLSKINISDLITNPMLMKKLGVSNYKIK